MDSIKKSQIQVLEMGSYSVRDGKSQNGINCRLDSIEEKNGKFEDISI